MVTAITGTTDRTITTIDPQVRRDEIEVASYDRLLEEYKTIVEYRRWSKKVVKALLRHVKRST
jgi:uncharacterized membrane protein